jgi:hypothetical protein
MYRSSQELFDSHLVKSRTHEEAGEWSLAVRELREALRLRPRSSGVRDDLERLKTMLTPPKQCDAILADRLSASFNLSVRYWDQNMPSAALKEVRFYQFISYHLSVSNAMRYWSALAFRVLVSIIT